jgi:hypothetical protein
MLELLVGSEWLEHSTEGLRVRAIVVHYVSNIQHINQLRHTGLALRLHYPAMPLTLC